MRRRTLLLAFGVFAACGEPYDGEIPIGDPPTRDAGGDEVDAGTVANDASDDTSTAADAGFDGDPCDRDRDGFRAEECDGGDDCDDDDNRAHPDAGFVTAKPTAKTNGDWNCDNAVSRETPSVNVSCGALLGQNCTTAGFQDDPACGDQGTYVTCKTVGGFACAIDTQTSRVQGCK